LYPAQKGPRAPSSTPSPPIMLRRHSTEACLQAARKLITASSPTTSRASGLSDGTLLPPAPGRHSHMSIEHHARRRVGGPSPCRGVSVRVAENGPRKREAVSFSLNADQCPARVLVATEVNHEAGTLGIWLGRSSADAERHARRSRISRSKGAPPHAAARGPL